MSLAYLAGLFGLITTIVWLVIGWRAMKAHEALAESVALIRRDVARLGDNLTPDDRKRAGLPKLKD